MKLYEKCRKKLYTCEWRYIGNDAVTIITKIPANEYDETQIIEQCSSHSGCGFNYYKSLKDAVACSIVPVNEIQFINIGKEEIDSI